MLWGQIIDHADSDEPGDERGEKPNADAGCDGPLIRLAGFGHAGSDRRENEDTFQSLTKNQNADIEDAGKRTGAMGQRVGSSGSRQSLPNE